LKIVLTLIANLLFSCGILHGQEYELSGTVKNEKSQPIPFASIILAQKETGFFVKGVSANEAGFFVFSDILKGSYLVSASYIGVHSKKQEVLLSKDSILKPLIIVEEIQELNEVVIIANKPVVKREVDRLVFNVENTVLSQNTSWEILKQTPGVIVMQDELQVRNQAVTVYINERKVHLAPEEVRALLENYQGANIKKIEVIANPSARYDADGGAVLNIVTTKNISLGYKGAIVTGYTQGILPKYSLGTNHFYKAKKWRIHTSYIYSPKKEFQNVNSTINFIAEDEVFSNWETTFERTKRMESHAIGLVFVYDLDTRNSFTITSNTLVTPYSDSDNFQATAISNSNKNDAAIFATRNFEAEVKSNIANDITYKRLLKGKGALTFNTHYTYFDTARNQDAISSYFLSDGTFLNDFVFATDATQEIDILTSQIDYTDIWDALSVETGLKGSFIRSRSKQDYFDLNSGRQLDENLSDDYKYNENVYAGYASFSKDWEKWSIKSGVRAEYTQSEGVSLALDTINNLDYLEVFPSFYLLHNRNENHSFSFDYARKVTRPRYQDLNPFKTFVNENNFFEGNPNLKPSFSHNFNLNYTLKHEFFFDFYYRDNGAYISTLSFQDNENLILKDITQNVLGSTSYGLDFTYGKALFKSWYLYNYISVFHEDETFIARESNNTIVTNRFNGVYIDVTNYLTLSKDGSFKGELGFNYASGFLEGSYIQEQTTNLTLGFRKSLWNKRALLSLAFNDVLGRANGRVTSNYLNQDNTYLAVPETQNFKVGFTYNFGNFRLEGNNRTIENKERDRLGKRK